MVSTSKKSLKLGCSQGTVWDSSASWYLLEDVWRTIENIGHPQWHDVASNMSLMSGSGGCLPFCGLATLASSNVNFQCSSGASQAAGKGTTIKRKWSAKKYCAPMMIVTRKLTCRAPLFPLICCFWGLFDKMSLDAKILHGFFSNLSHCSCQIGAMRFRASDKAKALYLAPLKAWAYQSDSRSFLGLKVITALQGFNHHGQRARQPKTIQNTLMSDHLKISQISMGHCRALRYAEFRHCGVKRRCVNGNEASESLERRGGRTIQSWCPRTTASGTMN